MANIIDLSIKTRDLVGDISLIAEATIVQLENAIAIVAKNAYAEAVRQAQARLKTTQRDYIRALQLNDLGDNIYILSLEGKHANSIEAGFAGFDMKPGLLNGPKAKIVKSGKNKGKKYATVPFFYQPKGKSPLSEKGEMLRREVQRLIKENKTGNTILNPSTGRPVQGYAARFKNTGVKDLEGLVKIQKTYDKRTQSTYMSFRRVSENSDKSKWIHPGYTGAKIFPYLESYIDREAQIIINSMFPNEYMQSSMSFI